MKLVTIAVLCVAAQAQTTKPTFEVASIKPPTPLGPMGQRANRKGGPGMGDPVRYTCENCPVFWVLSEAYDLKPYTYVGPGWVNDVRFDFDAKIPEGTSREAFREMLQSLLAERFKLAVHREPKEMPLYELTVMKGGPKFKESAPDDGGAVEGAAGPPKRDAEGFPILTKGMSMSIIPGHARIRSDAQTMPWLAQMLSAQMQSPVVDGTGLTAKYDYQVSWAYAQNNSAGAGGEDEYHPALMRALQSQLGLKLESKKGKVEVLVVDHIEKTPTAN
jgi:uncharacterized protein (TIGR03435 family)